MAERLDPRLVLRGYDGELWDENGNFLAMVNTWQAQINITNSDYQPAGSPLTVAIIQSYTVTLTFTETVIEDAQMLSALLDSLKQGYQPIFGFQGLLKGHDGTASLQVFRNCVPDGNIDMANVAPGDVLNRAWSFRVNDPPELSSLLGSGNYGTSWVEDVQQTDMSGS
jgi:hypothetical protein